MADALPPAGGGSGFLKNLNPRQRRYAAVLGIGGVLALIVVLSRRSEPAAAPAAAEPTAEDYGEAFSESSPIDPYGYAYPPDNSTFASALGESVSDALGDVGVIIEEQGLPSLGAGLSAQIGLLSGQVSQLQNDRKELVRDIRKELRGGKKGGGKKGGGGKPGNQGGKGQGGKGGGGKPGNQQGGGKGGGGGRRRGHMPTRRAVRKP